jgi:hypothetical protein
MESSFASLSLETFRLGESISRDCVFCAEFLKADTVPLFEHSTFHILSSLLHENTVYALSGDFERALCVVSTESVYLFSPSIENMNSFSIMVGRLSSMFPGQELGIPYVSDDWLISVMPSLAAYEVIVTTRSQAEAVYECSRLVELDGSRFSKLRAHRRRLLESGKLTFLPLGTDTLADACAVLDRWQSTQGHKYEKNRIRREEFTLGRFACLSPHVPADSSFEVGYYDAAPISIACFHRAEMRGEFGTIYLVKGIK